VYERCSSCGSDMPTDEPAFLSEGQIVCRDCHDQLQPVCAYCAADLPEPMAFQGKCPMCAQTLFVRKDQHIFDSSLLTRQQVRELETVRKSDLSDQPNIDRLYARKKSQLTTKSGTKPTPERVLKALAEEGIEPPKAKVDVGALIQSEEEDEGVRIEIGELGRMPVTPAEDGQLACFNCAGVIDLALGVYEYLGQQICLQCNGILNTSTLTETRVIRKAELFGDDDDDETPTETLPTRQRLADEEDDDEGPPVSTRPKTAPAKKELIKFYCRACGQKLGVPGSWIGKRLPCSRCKKLNWVPPDSDQARSKRRRKREA
jgi:hypothetical protein